MNTDFIKHKNFQDVMISVDKWFDYGHGIRVTGTWWNQGCVESWPIGEKVSLHIAKDQKDLKKGRSTLLSDWFQSMGSGPCLRYVAWRALG